MWPPADWTKRTDPSWISGSAWMAGYCTAGNVTSRLKSFRRVTPTRPPPE